MAWWCWRCARPLPCPKGLRRAESAPFTLSEWNKLARQIHDSPLKQPAALQGRTAADLARELALPPDDAERVVRLLDRSGRLALELEGLFSRGLWAVTRADEQYPAKLRDTLKHQAPTVLFGAGEIQLLRGGGMAVIGSRNIDEAGTAFAQEVGRKAAAVRLPVVSGGARGTDRLAMGAALEPAASLSACWPTAWSAPSGSRTCANCCWTANWCC